MKQIDKDNDLMAYLPKQDLGVEVKVRKQYAPIIQRVSKVIPDELLWTLFSSAPSETGGKIEFPYSRVDSAVINTRDIVWMLDEFRENYSSEGFNELYEKGCNQAFKALLWVEVGFQGLENLAKSPASKNWTTGVGHCVNDKERAEGIMTEGKKLYNDCLSKFAQFRKGEEIANDRFSQYQVEYLLDNF